MQFRDRIVPHPNRVRLVYVVGEENVCDLVREEGTPTDEGTPLNADNLNAITSDLQNELSAQLQQTIQTINDNRTYIGQILQFDYTGISNVSTDMKFDSVAKVEAYFGGTWEVYAPGRVLVGVGTSDQAFAAETTGGASNVTLTSAQIPSHTHSMLYTSGPQSYSTTVIQTHSVSVGGSGTISTGLNSGGGGSSHNNLQPYRTVYMFRRIA